ncbi:ATP-binding protein [Nonomuraea sp. NPDC050643]|uniref:ATP-binding protein n=1 Tax=Nonomuraea sp. NPDC050643 TaxID=3155660 RepID=UPI003408D695
MRVEFELRWPISADLALIRELIRSHGERGGLTGERLEGLVIAVNEAVTNVLDHGGKAGMVTALDTGDGVIVDVLDVAGLLTHEHLRAARVDPTASHGFGLWVIQHVCDDVVLQRSAQGSLLRMRVDRPLAAACRSAVVVGKVIRRGERPAHPSRTKPGLSVPLTEV